MNLIAFLLLIPAIVAYSISQLQQHGKFRLYRERSYGFWGEWSHTRKYKKTNPEGWVIDPDDNWYTRLFGIKYKERWPTSTNLTVFLTDGYHFMQFLFLLFISASITFAAGFTWLLLLLVWILVHIIHFLVYKLLQR